jgi:hypothetical protein
VKGKARRGVRPSGEGAGARVGRAPAGAARSTKLRRTVHAWRGGESEESERERGSELG